LLAGIPDQQRFFGIAGKIQHLVGQAQPSVLFYGEQLGGHNFTSMRTEDADCKGQVAQQQLRKLAADCLKLNRHLHQRIPGTFAQNNSSTNGANAMAVWSV
jgi:hypothetical protein